MVAYYQNVAREMYVYPYFLVLLELSANSESDKLIGHLLISTLFHVFSAHLYHFWACACVSSCTRTPKLCA